MPRVADRYGVRRVGTAALPGVRKTAAETALSRGAGLAQARAETGETIGQIGAGVARVGSNLFGQIQRDERDRADEVALLKAQNQLDAFELSLHDPQSGAFNLKGEAAFELPEKVGQQWRTLTGEIEQGLATNRQRLGFERMKQQRGHNVALNIRRHVSGELREFEARELKGTLENAVSLAAANSLNPKRVRQELLRGETAINAVATRMGLGPEAKTQQLEAFRSSAHIGVINNLLANEQDKAAQIYFKETKGQIAGDRQDELLKAIELGGRKRESQRLADDILKAGGTLKEQRDKAKSIDDPDTRDLVTSRLEHEAAVTEREARDAAENRLIEAANIIERTGRFDAIPAALLAQMPPGQRSSLRDYATAKAKGIPVETNLAVYYGYLGMAANDPAGFVQTNLMENVHQLDEVELKQLATLQLNMRQGKRDAAEKDLAGFRTKSEIIDNTLTQYGIETRPSEQTKQQKDAVAQLQRMLDKRVEAMQAEGVKVTNVEIQRVLDGLMGQGVDTPGTWWRNFGRWTADTWGTQRKRLIDMTIDDVPADFRKRAEGKLRRERLPVTGATILDVYLESQVK